MSDTISGNKEELTRSVNELWDNLTATINSLDGKVDANNTEANTALNKLKKLQEDLQSGKVSVSDYEKVIADINGNISTLEAATGEKFESVKSDVRGLNSALEAYKASIASQLDAMSDTVSGNKEELTRSVNELRDKGGYSAGYSKGVSDADGRVNTNSANYKGGYNKGVSDADGRVNTNSANYKGGYNAGYSAGQQKAQLKTVELYYNNETFRLHDDGKQLPLNALHSELYNGDDHRDWTYQFYGYTNKGMDIVFVQTLELSDSNRAQWVVVGSYDSSTGAIRIDTNRSDAKNMRCRIYYY